MNYPQWGKVIAAFIGGAGLAGLAVAVYFLHTSNDALEERLRELQASRDSLITTVEAAEAEGERLKREALEHNVFLGNP